MEKLCPITGKIINENVARLNSVLVILLFALYLITNNPLIIVFLIVDFAIRGYFDPKFSVLSIISKKLLQLMKVGAKKINAGPKIFAAQVGGGMSSLVLVCHLTGWSSSGCVVAGVLMLFAFLEASMGYCVACKLYPLIRSKAA